MSGWTEERKADVAKRWKDGESAGQIAKALGDVSRSAVIGMVHRMGLSGSNRAQPSMPARRIRPHGTNQFGEPGTRTKRQPRAKPPKPYAPPRQAWAWKPRVVEVTSDPCTMLTLPKRACKWPVGPDPLPFCMDEQLFCAAGPLPDGEVYCCAHRAIGVNVVATQEQREKAARELERGLRRWTA